MGRSNEYDSVSDIYDAYVQADFDLEFFRQECAAAPGPVLELMAGTGRVSFGMAERASSLTCVDLSLEMLRRLRGKAAAGAERPLVVCADARLLPFRNEFALVVIPFHAFAEITGRSDRMEAMRQISGSLLEGGRFICTLHNPAVRRRSLANGRKCYGKFDLPEGDGRVELWVEGDVDSRTGQARSVQEFKLYGPDGRLASERRQIVRFSLIEREEFSEMARASGFEILDLLGDYGRQPFDPRESPYMIWSLRKRARNREGRSAGDGRRRER